MNIKLKKLKIDKKLKRELKKKEKYMKKVRKISIGNYAIAAPDAVEFLDEFSKEQEQYHS